MQSLSRTFQLLSLVVICFIISAHADDATTEKPAWTNKKLTDYSDADMERLLDQWNVSSSIWKCSSFNEEWIYLQRFAFNRVLAENSSFCHKNSVVHSMNFLHWTVTNSLVSFDVLLLFLRQLNSWLNSEWFLLSSPFIICLIFTGKRWWWRSRRWHSRAFKAGTANRLVANGHEQSREYTEGVEKRPNHHDVCDRVR